MASPDWGDMSEVVLAVENRNIPKEAVITHISYRGENGPPSDPLSNAVCIDFMVPDKEEAILFTHELSHKPNNLYNVLGGILDILEEFDGYKVDPTVRRRLFK